MNIQLSVLALYMIIGGLIGGTVVLAACFYIVGSEVPPFIVGLGSGVGAWVGQLNYFRKVV